jgi:hypothetical protein
VFYYSDFDAPSPPEASEANRQVILPLGDALSVANSPLTTGPWSRDPELVIAAHLLWSFEMDLDRGEYTETNSLGGLDRRMKPMKVMHSMTRPELWVRFRPASTKQTAPLPLYYASLISFPHPRQPHPKQPNFLPSSPAASPQAYHPA